MYEQTHITSNQDSTVLLSSAMTVQFVDLVQILSACDTG